jgi:endonuclease YncB( thermonuclease family)
MSRRRSPTRFAGRESRSRSRLGKGGDLLLAIAVLGLVALVVSRWNEPMTRVEGRASVVDGDTLIVTGERVRLRQIDAPELAQTCLREGGAQPCGREARAHLVGLVGDAEIVCDVFGRDDYGRLLVECVADDRSLNAGMVEAGWAIADGGYLDEQSLARDARRGLWAGEFDRPSDWRSEHGGEERSSSSGFWHWLHALFGS